MQNNYRGPKHLVNAFHCPHCNTYANQVWKYVFSNQDNNASDYYGMCSEFNTRVAKCDCCKKNSIWVDSLMVYPKKVTAPIAHYDMPISVKVLYDEARNVSVESARAAAALLRVSLEKLTEELGETGGKLNTRIGRLKSKGLDQVVINALDTVRIYSNEGGAHSGEIDLTGEDNKEIVDKLFYMVNYIVEQTISKPKEINNMFKSLPEDKLRGINNRDREN